MGFMFFKSFGVGKKTATAATRIQYLLPGADGPGKDEYCHLVNIRVVTAGTPHVLKVLRAASAAKVATSLAAAGTSLVVDAALVDGGGNVVANLDFLAIRLDNGNWHLSTISGWTAGTKTAVLNTAIPANRTAAKGAPVFSYGVPGDSYHDDATYDLTASVTNQFPATDAGDASLMKNKFPGAPLLIDIDNATAASVVTYTQGAASK